MVVEWERETHPQPKNRYFVSFAIITRYNDRTPERSKIWDMSYAAGVRLSRCKSSKRRVDETAERVNSTPR